jgi:hypothetical protein
MRSARRVRGGAEAAGSGTPTIPDSGRVAAWVAPGVRSAGRCGPAVLPGWCGPVVRLAFRRAAIVRVCPALRDCCPVVRDIVREFPEFRDNDPEFRGSDPDCRPVREVGPAYRVTTARRCCRVRALGTGLRLVPAFDPSLRNPSGRRSGDRSRARMCDRRRFAPRTKASCCASGSAADGRWPSRRGRGRPRGRQASLRDAFFASNRSGDLPASPAVTVT